MLPASRPVARLLPLVPGCLDRRPRSPAWAHVDSLFEAQVHVLDVWKSLAKCRRHLDVRLQTLAEPLVSHVELRRIVIESDDGVARVGDVDLRHTLGERMTGQRVDHPGRAFIALANLYRHEGIFDETLATEIKALASPRYVERARLLGAMLRVVYLLSASMPGIIPKLRWERRDDGTLALVIPASHAGLFGERPTGRLSALARISGRTLELVVAR